MDEKTKERIRRVIASTFGVPVTQVPDNAAAGEFPLWTSLGHLDLMMAVELEFDVTIPSDVMLKLLSLNAIEKYLQNSE